MIDESKLPEYREKVFQYIQNEIIPKYSEIKSCKMHVLPKNVIYNVEFLFLLNLLSENRLSQLKNEVEQDLYYFVDSLNINGPYMSRVILIFL